MAHSYLKSSKQQELYKKAEEPPAIKAPRPLPPGQAQPAVVSSGFNNHFQTYYNARRLAQMNSNSAAPQQTVSSPSPFVERPIANATKQGRQKPGSEPALLQKTLQLHLSNYNSSNNANPAVKPKTDVSYSKYFAEAVARRSETTKAPGGDHTFNPILKKQSRSDSTKDNGLIEQHPEDQPTSSSPSQVPIPINARWNTNLNNDIGTSGQVGNSQSSYFQKKFPGSTVPEPTGKISVMGGRPETAGPTTPHKKQYGGDDAANSGRGLQRPNVFRREPPRPATAVTPVVSKPTPPSEQAEQSGDYQKVFHPFHESSKSLYPSYVGINAVRVKSPMDLSFPLLAPYLIASAKPGAKTYRIESADKLSILTTCKQAQPVPISIIFDHLKKVSKIGEGVFGEVYIGFYAEQPSVAKVFKVVPIEGDKLVNQERQKRYHEIESEIIVSRRLNYLRNSEEKNYTEAFAKLNGALVCKGAYPRSLLSAWKKFGKDKGSDNDVPIFNEGQEYAVLESELYGTDVESHRFKNSKQALSLLVQVAHALAVGEAGVKFEHRDLHWGNILVMPFAKASVRYKIDGENFLVPSCGLKATIIDYTIASTENDDGEYVFTDLSQDEDQFNGDEDYQFEIYRMMRDELQNDWSQFAPKNNIYWLHYLVDKLIKRGHYSETTGYVHSKYMGKLRYFKSIIKEFHSCTHFALSYPEEDILKIDAVDAIP